MTALRPLALALSTVLLASCASSPFSQTAQYPCNTQMQSASDELRIYQIMVESFVDGDPTIGHGTGYGTSHHNGDLQGIIDSLDYIQSLGMNAIWLTPIFESAPVEGQSHWDDRLDATGYFATDFFKIDPRFGTLEKARELVNKAHAKGMYVFFDGVFGHHKQSGVKPSPTGLLPAGNHNPVDYPESLPFYKEVATYWINELKIDGWRLDQAYQVPLDAWQEIRKAVDETSRSVTYTNHNGEQVNPLGYMVAEIWKEENTIAQVGYGTDQSPALCSAFDFPMRYRMVETFGVAENGLGDRGASWLAEGMSLHSLYPEHAQPNLMMSNHDMVRFGDLLQRGDIAEPDEPAYWLRHKAAFSFMTAYSGPITLFYGDEIGQETPNFAEPQRDDQCAIRGHCDDHSGRISAKIDSVTTTLNPQQRDLKEYVSRLMQLRAEHPALHKGERIHIHSDNNVYVDHKQHADDAILYTVSASTEFQMLTLSSAEVGSEDRLLDLMSGEIFFPKNGEYTIRLKPFESRFLQIETPFGKAPMPRKKGDNTLYADGFLGQCDNPTVEGGQFASPLYVIGSFPDSGWSHKKQRAFAYKGHNTYQVVTNEVKGSYKFQYATTSWSPQFTAENVKQTVGKVVTGKKGGYGQDTSVLIPEAGKYVWSMTFHDDGAINQVMVAKCR